MVIASDYGHTASFRRSASRCRVGVQAEGALDTPTFFILIFDNLACELDGTRHLLALITEFCLASRD